MEGLTFSPALVAAAAVVLCLAVLLLGRLALAAQRQPPATGVETFIGQQALARSAIGAGVRGQVAIHGELWQAESDVAVEAGEFVRVTQVNGLTFTVVPDRSRTPSGDIAWKA